jgi:hypothetical protein
MSSTDVFYAKQSQQAAILPDTMQKNIMYFPGIEVSPCLRQTQ